MNQLPQNSCCTYMEIFAVSFGSEQWDGRSPRRPNHLWVVPCYWSVIQGQLITRIACLILSFIILSSCWYTGSELWHVGIASVLLRWGQTSIWLRINSWVDSSYMVSRLSRELIRIDIFRSRLSLMNWIESVSGQRTWFVSGIDPFPWDTTWDESWMK